MSTVYPSSTVAHSTPVVERTSVSASIQPARDRVRWGAIIAGLFTTITSLFVLSLLGAAIGFSSVDPGDSPSRFGIGAGVWGILSALLAFFFGGWMAAWGGRETGERNGITQGVMVWMTVIPLSIYLAASGAGAVARTVGSALGTGATVASNAANAAAQDPEARDATRGAADTLTTQATGENLQNGLNQARASVTPDRIERTADAAAKTTWATLGATMLALAAAAAGGFIGGDHHKDHYGEGRRVRVNA